jgi:hypothetical protein
VGRSENEPRRTPLDVQPVGDKKRQRGVAATGSIRSKAVWRSQIEDSPTFKLTN